MPKINPTNIPDLQIYHALEEARARAMDEANQSLRGFARRVTLKKGKTLPAWSLEIDRLTLWLYDQMGFTLPDKDDYCEHGYGICGRFGPLCPACNPPESMTYECHICRGIVSGTEVKHLGDTPYCPACQLKCYDCGELATHVGPYEQCQGCYEAWDRKQSHLARTRN